MTTFKRKWAPPSAAPLSKQATPAAGVAQPLAFETRTPQPVALQSRPSLDPLPAGIPRPEVRPLQRPDLAALAQTRGHCGTCRHFYLESAEGRFMGVCSLGRGAFEPHMRHSRLAAVIHEAARCMTLPFPRWAQRSGVEVREVSA